MTAKAHRFISKPFIITGYQVTAENMQQIADWCQGHVIESGKNPFIRVPVYRVLDPRQTEAYVGMWVTMSIRKGEPFCKVYPQEWLTKSFNELPDDFAQVPLIEDKPLVPVFSGGNTVANPRTVPMQAKPSSPQPAQ